MTLPPRRASAPPTAASPQPEDPAEAAFAVEAAGLGTWRWDAASDVVVWSARQCALHGLAPDRFGGTYEAFLELVHPDDRERVAATVAHWLAEGAERGIEYRTVWPDGTIRWIVGWGRAVPATAGRGAAGAAGLVGVAMDVTDRKTAELRSRLLAAAGEVLAADLDSRLRLERVARLLVPDLADWCAIDLLEEDGLLHRLTVTHRRPERAALAEELRRRYPVLSPDADHTLARVLRTGASWLDPAMDPERLVAEARDPAHAELLRRLGFQAEMVVPMVVRGRALGTITLVLADRGRGYDAAALAFAEELARRCAVALDHARLFESAQREIAARQAAEAALRASEERLRIGLRDSPVIVYQQDRDLRYVWLYTPRGYAPPETIVGKTDFDSLPYHQAERLAVLKRRVLETGEVLREEVVATTARTGERVYDLLIEPLRDAAGDIVGVTGSAIDVTEHRRREERGRRLQALTADLARAATTEQVVAAVADHARQALGAERAGVSVPTVAGTHLRRLRAPGRRHGGPAVPIDADHPLAEAARSGEPLLLATGAALRARYPALERSGEPPGALVVLPLTGDGGLEGVLDIEFAADRPLDAEERSFVATLGSLCAQALARARLFDREREARAKAEALEARFRATFEQSAIGMAHARPDGRWLRVNPKLCELLGYRRDELLALTFRDVTDPADRAATDEAHRRLLRGEVDTYALEKRFVRKDGGRIWVNVTVALVRTADGEPDYTIGLIEDISPRKAAEAERERLLARVDEERARLEAVLQQLPVGVAIAEAPSGRIVLTNERLRALLGASPGSAASLADDDRYSLARPDGTPLPGDAFPIARALRDGEVVTGEEALLRRADGTQAAVRVAAAPIRDRDGRIVAGVATLEDVTAAKRAEAAQRLLAEAGELLAARLDDETTLSRLARLTVPGFADACLVDLIEPGAPPRTPVVAARDAPRERELRVWHAPCSPLVDPTHPLAPTLAAGLPLVLPEVAVDAGPTAASLPDDLARWRAMGAASLLCVPLMTRDRPFGSITFLMDASGRRFDEAAVGLAQELARRAAAAIDNRRLYAGEQRARERAERATERMRRLQSLTAALAEALTVEQVAAVVVDQGMVGAGARGGSLALLAAERGAVEVVRAEGHEAATVEPWRRFPIDAPVPLAEAIRSRQAILLGSPEELAERYPALREAARRTGNRAFAALPLIVEGRAIGAVGLSFPESRAFPREEVAFLLAFARQGAQALERARLYEAEREARDAAEAARSRLAFLAEASATLATSLDYAATLRRMAELLVPALADWCTVHLVAEDGAVEQLVVAHADPAKVAWARTLQERFPYDPDAPAGVPNVLRTGRPELYPVVTDELLAAATDDPERLALLREVGFASAMIVPLVAHGVILGAISLIAAESGRHYTPDDLALAEDLARRAALAVLNARHYRAEERARQEAERATARRARLQAITASLAEALTPDDVARALAEHGVATLGAGSSSVAVRDASGDRFRVIRVDGRDPAAGPRSETMAADAAAPLAEAIRTRAPVLLASRQEVAARYPSLVDVDADLPYEAKAAFPLLFEGRAIGAIGFSFAAPRAFTDDDLAFMLALARQSAVALERARLYDAERRARDQAEAAERRARRDADRIATLAELSRAFAETALDFQAVLDATTRITAARTGDCCVVRLRSEDGDWMDVASLAHPDPARLAAYRAFLGARRQRADESFSGDVLRTGRPFLLPDTADPATGLLEEEHRRRIAVAGIASLVVVPLRARERLIGTLALLRDRPGPPFGADDVAFVQEMADRAALALDNARLYQEAREAVRARDEFLSVAAHELRTPVTTVKGYAQMLGRAQQREGFGSARAAQYIRAIESATDRLRLLADDLLDVSRLRLGQLPLRPRPVDLVELTEAAIARAAEQQGEEHPIRLAVRGAPPPVFADPDRIDQILGNLLENAAKYSPAGSPTAVTLEPEEGGVLVSVRDAGIGLPPAELETIFEPFNRASNAARDNLPGLGLGLFICRSIAERHGGRIWAESAGEGQGTTMRLWLPTEAATGGRLPEPTDDPAAG